MARWFHDRSPRLGIPSVSLRRVFPDARFRGCRDLEVSGCATDSRRLEPGEVFVALRGARRDGHQFVSRAIERGAAAIVVDRPCEDGGPLQIIVPDTRLAHARLAHALAGEPSRRVPVIAVAGTIGRTPTAHYLRAIFAAAGRRYGQIGALGWTDGRHDRPLGAAAPGSQALAEMIAALVDDGCQGVILEVSPDQLRRQVTSALTLAGAVITDLPVVATADGHQREMLNRDHARLVRRVIHGGLTVVNADDEATERLGATNLEARRVAFGRPGLGDVSASVSRQDADEVTYLVTTPDAEVAITLPRTRSWGVTQALAAATYGLACGLPGEAISEGIASVHRLPGFLEPIREGQPFDVWTDQATREAELTTAIHSVRPITAGKLIAVLSVNARESIAPSLIHLLESQVDRLVLTVDDASDPDPDSLLDEALARLRRPGRVRAEPDRDRAIEVALEIATPGDAVLLTGCRARGLRLHENRPAIEDDRSIATRHLRRRHGFIQRRSA